jgi:hypothetical protein
MEPALYPASSSPQSGLRRRVFRPSMRGFDIPHDRPCIRGVPRALPFLSIACLLWPLIAVLGAEETSAPPSATVPAPPAAQIPVVRAIPAVSSVFEASDERAMVNFEPNAAVIRRMVDALVMRATAAESVAEAWRRLIAPEDRVGIKINAVGAPLGGTRVEVVEAVLAGLEQAGFPRARASSSGTATPRPSGAEASPLNDWDAKSPASGAKPPTTIPKSISPPWCWDRSSTAT